jgi:hypothetical protein
MSSYLTDSSTQTVEPEVPAPQAAVPSPEEEKAAAVRERQSKLREYRRNQGRVLYAHYPFADVLKTRSSSCTSTIRVFYDEIVYPGRREPGRGLRRIHPSFYQWTGEKVQLSQIARRTDIDGFRLVKDHQGVDKIWVESNSYWRENKHNRWLPYLSDKQTQTEKPE